MKAALAVWLLLAMPAAAQPASPWLYDVTGVMPGSALNIRADPGPGAAVIGTLASDAARVEVVNFDPGGVWGQVNIGEGSGWVAMRFLAPRVDVWPMEGLPATLRCSGNEPFWSVRPENGLLTYATPENEVALDLRAVLGTGAQDDPRRALIAEGADGRMTLSVTPAACSDGMSNRAFGLSVALVDERGAARRLLTGCCSIAP